MTEGGTTPSSTPTPGRRRAERPPLLGGLELDAPPVPRPSWQSRRWRLTVIGAATALALAWVIWYAMTPESLPTNDKVVQANGIVGTPLYVGMFAAPDDLGRAIRISGVKVQTSADVKLEVTPLLCRRGTVGVTTKPEQFCTELINPEGQRLVSGDSIVVKVESATPALAIVDRVRIAYREDIRWDTQPAGNKQAIVTIAGRP